MKTKNSGAIDILPKFDANRVEFKTDYFVMKHTVNVFKYYRF